MGLDALVTIILLYENVPNRDAKTGGAGEPGTNDLTKQNLIAKQPGSLVSTLERYFSYAFKTIPIKPPISSRTPWYPKGEK